MRVTSLNDLIERGRKLGGRWKLGKSGVVEYRSLGADKRLTLKAGVIAAKPEALLVSFTEKRDRRAVTRLAELSGDWSVDARNRLVFSASRESGRRDRLTFEGFWQLDKRQKLVYRLRSTPLKTRTRREQELSFSGDWKLDKGRLIYSVSGSSSALRLRGAFETSSVAGGMAEVRYQLGTEARPPRALVFFGRCTLSRGASRIDLELTTRAGKDLGAELTLSRDLHGGNIFVRLKKALEESRAEAGVSVRW